MQPDEIKAKKKKIRAEAVQQARELDETYVSDSNQKISENIMSLEEYKTASVIFCFISMPFEIDTRAIVCSALKSGKRVCVPKCSREEPGIMTMPGLPKRPAAEKIDVDSTGKISGLF